MIDTLAEARKAADMSQRELSALLGRPHNYIYLVEKGNRMLNFCELMECLHFLSADPVEAMKRVVELSGKRVKRRSTASLSRPPLHHRVRGRR